MHPSQFGLFGEYLYKVRRALLKGLENAFVLGKLGGPMTVDGIHAMIEPLKAMYPERNLCPKTIRQSVISYWLNERNLPLEEVQDLAGHRYPSATEQYKRMDIEEKNSWVNQFHPMGREHNQPNR
jgi:site-specific recombinase XerD